MLEGGRLSAKGNDGIDGGKWTGIKVCYDALQSFSLVLSDHSDVSHVSKSSRHISVMR